MTRLFILEVWQYFTVISISLNWPIFWCRVKKYQITRYIFTILEASGLVKEHTAETIYNLSKPSVKIKIEFAFFQEKIWDFVFKIVWFNVWRKKCSKIDVPLIFKKQKQKSAVLDTRFFGKLKTPQFPMKFFDL